MEATLVLGAGLMGLAGTPHCAAMCGAPCAAVARRFGGPSARLGFFGGRLLAYAGGGAVAAAGVAGFAQLGAVAPALLPLWTALHMAVLGLGLWLLATGRQPGWWARLGRAAPPMPLSPDSPVPAGWQRVSVLPRSGASALRAGLVGSLWLALPCGLLQSALVVAALADTPAQGAAAMAGFAVASSLGLWLPQAVATRIAGWTPVRAADRLRAASWALRLAGLALVLASGWAVGHGLWQRVALLCSAG